MLNIKLIKMKAYIYIVVILALAACSPNSNSMVEPKKADKSALALSESVMVVAELVIHPVTIKNPNIEDEWTEEALGGLNRLYLVKAVINAIEQGKLTPYDYFTEEQLSVKDINVLLEENGGIEAVGNIQFTEDWFIDPETLQITKQVRAMVFGFESFDEDGLVKSYKAAFMVNLPKYKKQGTQIAQE